MAEVRTRSATGGEKGVKPERYDLIPVEPLAEVARHYGAGAAKYDDRNWERGYPWSNSYAAMMRHANAFWSGEEMDPEMGTAHLAAVVFHAFTLMQFAKYHRSYDDRSRLGREPDEKPVPRDNPAERQASHVYETRLGPRGGTIVGRSRNPADGPDR